MAGAAGYVLEIASDVNFATVVYRAETLKARHTPTVRLGSRLQPNYYYWRVTPFAYTTNISNRAYATPSETWTFTINWLASPQQIAPADDIVTPFLPRFSGRLCNRGRRPTNSKLIQTATLAPTYSIRLIRQVTRSLPHQATYLTIRSTSGASRPPIKMATKPPGVPCAPSESSGIWPPSS